MFCGMHSFDDVSVDVVEFYPVGDLGYVFDQFYWFSFSLHYNCYDRVFAVKPMCVSPVRC